MEQQGASRHSLLQCIFPFVFAIGIMLSPDTFMVLGNFFGKTGVFGLFLICLSALFYLTFILQFKRSFQIHSKESTDAEAPGPILAESSLSGFFLLTRLTAVIFLSTGLLVSSGFVFNEVFLYWFPNFAFAFILLGFLIVLQFLTKKTVLFFQSGFVGICLICFLILITAGLIQMDPFSFSSREKINFIPAHISLNMIFKSMVLFIGFEMGLYISASSDSSFETKGKTVFSAIIFMAVLFMAWGVLSITCLPLEKLSHTSIPHILTAKKILGASGRFLMGTMIIFGSLAVIHGLFTLISQQVSDRFEGQNKTSYFKKPGMIISCSGLIIAALMAGGMAGSEKLETYISGSLILWLISYSFISFHFLKSFKNPIFFLIFVITISVLIATDNHPFLMVKFLSITLSLIILISMICNKKTIWRN